MARSKLQQRLFASAIGLIGFALLLVALEIGLRAAGFSYPPKDEPIALWNRDEDRAMRLGLGLHRSAGRQLWEPRPGASLPAHWVRESERINDLAYRGPRREPSRANGVLRIATMGDSSTFGYGVPYAVTYSAQLEQILRAEGRSVEVLDFGVIGYTLLQGIERYREVVRRYHPDVVVAAFGAVNDHHPAQGPRDSDKIAGARPREGRWQALFRVAREESRILHGLAYVVTPSSVEDPEETAAREAVLLERHLQHQHMGELDFEVEHRGLRRVPLDEFQSGLETLAQLVQADGAKLILLSLPRRPGVEGQSPVLRAYSQAMAEFCAKQSQDRGAAPASIQLCDARADLREYRQRWNGDPNLNFLDGDDFHPSKRGHRRLAELLRTSVAQACGWP